MRKHYLRVDYGVRDMRVNTWVYQHVTSLNGFVAARIYPGSITSAQNMFLSLKELGDIRTKPSFLSRDRDGAYVRNKNHCDHESYCGHISLISPDEIKGEFPYHIQRVIDSCNRCVRPGGLATPSPFQGWVIGVDQERVEQKQLEYFELSIPNFFYENHKEDRYRSIEDSDGYYTGFVFGKPGGSYQCHGINVVEGNDHFYTFSYSKRFMATPSPEEYLEAFRKAFPKGYHATRHEFTTLHEKGRIFGWVNSQHRDYWVKNTTFPLFGIDEYFRLYSPGIPQALGDAAASADGLHLSRLAGEIACDGLVIQSVTSLLRKIRSQRVQRVILGDGLELWRKTKWKTSRGWQEMLRAYSYKQKVFDVKAFLSDLPKLWLNYQYGLAAPLREYASLPGAIDNHFNGDILRPLTGSAHTNVGQFSVNTRVSLNLLPYHPNDQAIAELAYLTKGGLCIDDIWELVPLSFVVDWFTSLGDLFTSLRNNEIYSKLPIDYGVISSVWERAVEIPRSLRDIARVIVPITHRYYHREYRRGDSFPNHIFSLNVGGMKGSVTIGNLANTGCIVYSFAKGG